MKYDIIIIGAGPAGICAAIYALRANKKILLLEKETIGGKIASSPLVENYPGLEAITGIELADHLQKQVETLGGEIQAKEVFAIRDRGQEKEVITKDKTYCCYTIIIATGTKYKTLGIAKEEALIGRGISFCATCDGFFYKNKTVAVIGGGNTAIANALELANLCEKVYVIQNLNFLTGEPILIGQLEAKENIEILYHTTIEEIIGEERITGIKIQKKEKSKTKKEILTIEGLFLSIGQISETKLGKEIIQMDQQQYITVNQEGMTNKSGIFAAGDCVSKKVRQLTTAVSDGTIAALGAIQYLEKLNYK